MADVADHLVPMDGLTNSFITLKRIEPSPKDASITVVFAMFDEDDFEIGEFEIEVRPHMKNKDTKTPIDDLVAEAHRRMVDILRQWIYVMDKQRAAYER